MSVERALKLFKAVVRDGGSSSIAVIAKEQNVPLSTAQRWIAAFERQGLLVQSGQGRRTMGLELGELAGSDRSDQVLRAAALPLLRRFARANRTTVHLGRWDGEMVSYLAKASSGPAIFTLEGMKLEGYCSAIGKVLLAHLGAGNLDDYLAGGPFIALTHRTIITCEQLRDELAQVARQGFAIDDGEVQEGLLCCAVPVRDQANSARAALSMSVLHSGKQPAIPPMVEKLTGLRLALERRIFGTGADGDRP
ncbi:IclR family transcriptional regulator [Sphingomonas mali]|uniref:IclR family transcriptional regulator n=1 Tax=Sphingomonas mali TaxID=40682 RepID=UPI0008313618|nr:IclR family transcriptional regulator [Sphingomonas mali]